MTSTTQGYRHPCRFTLHTNSKMRAVIVVNLCMLVLVMVIGQRSASPANYPKRGRQGLGQLCRVRNVSVETDLCAHTCLDVEKCTVLTGDDPRPPLPDDIELSRCLPQTCDLADSKCPDGLQCQAFPDVSICVLDSPPASRTIHCFRTIRELIRAARGGPARMGGGTKRMTDPRGRTGSRMRAGPGSRGRS